ncbi:MAG: hypothetical protein KF691_04605 [Phycisphaeraceae bacterium]|nr:hypothetical protein [Phycisphaeraceae bacterium]
MESGKHVALGRALLGGLALAAAGAALWSCEVASAQAQNAEAPEHVDPSFNTGAWTAESPDGVVSITPDGSYWISKVTRGEDPGYQRQVTRFKANRTAKNQPSSQYFVRVTGRQSNGNLVNFNPRPRMLKRPYEAKPKSIPEEQPKPLDEDTNEMGLVMPDEGTAVLNGTAPIIGVKKATVASAGTTFAIEATSTSWLLKVIAADAENPVEVFFPESNQRPRAFAVGDCVRYQNDATLPAQGVLENSAACDDLLAYANWILQQTP